MDELWHSAILDTKLYADLQAALGLSLHHRPSGASDQEAEPREKRLTVMPAIYNAFFLNNPLGSDPSQPMRTQGPAGLTESNFYIYVKTTTGETLTINIVVQATIYELKSVIRHIRGIRQNEQLLLYAGARLENSRSLEDYSLGNGFTLELFFETVRMLNRRKVFLVEVNRICIRKTTGDQFGKKSLRSAEAAFWTDGMYSFSFYQLPEDLILSTRRPACMEGLACKRWFRSATQRVPKIDLKIQHLAPTNPPGALLRSQWLKNS